MSHSKPTTLVIDSLSWVLRHIKCPTVCRTLHQLRKGDKWPWMKEGFTDDALQISCMLLFQEVEYSSFSSSLSFSCVFIRWSYESCHWSAPHRHAPTRHCGKCRPLGHFCHHCCTRYEGRWSSGEDNKAAKIREGYPRCRYWGGGVLTLPAVAEDAKYFVPRRKFSASKRILQSHYRAEPTKSGPNMLTLGSRRCSIAYIYKI